MLICSISSKDTETLIILSHIQCLVQSLLNTIPMRQYEEQEGNKRLIGKSHIHTQDEINSVKKGACYIIFGLFSSPASISPQAISNNVLKNCQPFCIDLVVWQETYFFFLILDRSG